jgi:ABC-type glycerol-3-phosphate transport system substrate-binding protein
MKRSCLGGWNLAINKYSPNQKAAWEFIRWMTQKDAQQFAAIVDSFTVALKSIYSDPKVFSANPHFQELESIIQQDLVQLRPVHPQYQMISNTIIQPQLHSALTGTDSVINVLRTLQRRIQPYFPH